MFGLQRRDATLVTFLAVLVIGVMVASSFGSRYFEERIVASQAEADAIRWGQFVHQHMSDMHATLSYGRVTDEDQEILNLVSEGGNIFRYKFFNETGVIVLASRLEDLGTVNTKPYFASVVQQGGTFVKIAAGAAPAELQPGADRTALGDEHAEETMIPGANDHDEHRDVGGRHIATVAEAYVPIVEGGRFLGAIEVYSDASVLAEDVKSQVFEAQLALLGLLALFAMLIAMAIVSNVRDRNRQLGTMQRAHESMSKAEEEVLRLNEELEQRVHDRTSDLEKANAMATEAADGMKRLNEELERRVEERTEQMTKANDQLYRLNESMTKLNESLEQRVQERTAEMERANASVKQLNEELEQRVDERTAELQQAQSDLVRSERLATLGQLTATVSHELRNPLGAIRTAIYLIRGRTENQGLGVESALERADRSISRCDNIINELLDFTRSTPLAPEATVFDHWLESVLSEQNLPPAVSLQKQTGTGGVEVAFDHERLRRVIINVFNNACEAMVEAVENGQITHDPMLMVDTRINGQRVEVLFRDNGPGIPPDVLAKIFEPLYSTKSFGVGLGLPTVRQIMEQHDGGIEITSQQGQGTDVLLWLPANRADERAA